MYLNLTLQELDYATDRVDGCKVTVLVLSKAQREHKHGVSSVYVSSGTVARNTA